MAKKLDFINAVDLTTAKDEGNYRRVSFAMNEKRAMPNTIRLLGVLYHNTTITFDKENAKKMRDFCQEILDKCES